MVKDRFTLDNRLPVVYSRLLAGRADPVKLKVFGWALWIRYSLVHIPVRHSLKKSVDAIPVKLPWSGKALDAAVEMVATGSVKPEKVELVEKTFNRYPASFKSLLAVAIAGQVAQLKLCSKAVSKAVEKWGYIARYVFNNDAGIPLSTVLDTGRLEHVVFWVMRRPGNYVFVNCEEGGK